MNKYLLIPVSAMMLCFASCKKSTEVIETAAISDYSPLVVGKYISYSLDSLVYTDFGAASEIRSYQVKYLVDAAISDNLNRPAYRIIRFIRKTQANPWVPDATFEAVNTNGSLEFKENNLRFIKLRLPIRDGFSWKGNTYIDTYSFNSDVKYLDDWDYIYENVGALAMVGTYSLENTITVNQRDEEIGNPTDPNSYSEFNEASEKYAKGIGMVYRKFLHSEYQPPTPGRDAYTQGYGVTLTMIDHN